MKGTGIALIGEEDYIQGFRGLGASVFPVNDAAGAEEALLKLKNENYSIVFITEEFARHILGKIDHISSTGRMNISIIPGKGGKKDIAGEMMRRITIRATGMDPVRDK